MLQLLALAVSASCTPLNSHPTHTPISLNSSISRIGLGSINSAGENPGKTFYKERLQYACGGRYRQASDISTYLYLRRLFTEQLFCR
jgi:hypothetical protein